MYTVYTYIFEILDELKNFLNVAVFAILGVIIRGLFQLQTNVCWFKILRNQRRYFLRSMLVKNKVETKDCFIKIQVNTKEYF